MASIKDLLPAAVTADVDLLLGGPTLRLTYNPRRITFQQDGAKVEPPDDGKPVPKGRDAEAFASARSVCHVVTAWDLTGPVPTEDGHGMSEGEAVPEGEPVPLDPLVVSLLPIPLLSGIVAGVTIHAMPNPTKTATVALLNGSRG